MDMIFTYMGMTHSSREDKQIRNKLCFIKYRWFQNPWYHWPYENFLSSIRCVPCTSLLHSLFFTFIRNIKIRTSLKFVIRRKVTSLPKVIKYVKRSKYFFQRFQRKTYDECSLKKNKKKEIWIVIWVKYYLQLRRQMTLLALLGNSLVINPIYFQTILADTWESCNKNREDEKVKH